MEFERNTPATAEDIALADAPKVTVQPSHDVDFQPVIHDRSHRNEGSFVFENESTAASALAASTTNDHSHHRMAIAISVAIALLFGGAIAALYLLR